MFFERYNYLLLMFGSVPLLVGLLFVIVTILFI